jgi:hypothetical protein
MPDNPLDVTGVRSLARQDGLSFDYGVHRRRAGGLPREARASFNKTEMGGGSVGDGVKPRLV